MREIIRVNYNSKILSVGEPRTKREMQEMFELRTTVYKEKGYIPFGQADKDDYDRDGKCVYFVAEVRKQIVGTVRLIIDDPLRTELYFDFKEPREISSIPRDKRAELSRLVVKGKDLKMNQLILWNLVKAAVGFGEENDYQGGYANIRRGVSKILNRIGIPFHSISSYTLKSRGEYKGERLSGYFQEKVLPIYYLRDEVAEVIRKKEKELDLVKIH